MSTIQIIIVAFTITVSLCTILNSIFKLLEWRTNAKVLESEIRNSYLEQEVGYLQKQNECLSKILMERETFDIPDYIREKEKN